MKKQQSKRVIPGFGLTMGVTLAMLSIVVLIPLASLAVYSARLGFREFIEVITRPRVLSGFYVSFITAFAATVINAIMGLVLAWVLVRYDFPGKRIMDGMIELPFALPTAVAGISLTSLTSDKGLVGSFFANFGIKIAYTRIGITVALIFVGIPFVVRAIQPVLEKLDGSYEEAARVMGARSEERRVGKECRSRCKTIHRFPQGYSSGASAGNAFRGGTCLRTLPGRIRKRCFYRRKQALLYRDHAADHHVKASGV